METEEVPHPHSWTVIAQSQFVIQKSKTKYFNDKNIYPV